MCSVYCYELDKKPEEFWNLNWYEFGLWSLRIRGLKKIEFDRGELMIELTRSFMALYHNHNMVMGKGSKTISPQDLWKLSYDREQEPELSKEEKEEQMKAFMEKAKKRIKKNG